MATNASKAQALIRRPSTTSVMSDRSPKAAARGGRDKSAAPATRKAAGAPRKPGPMRQPSGQIEQRFDRNSSTPALPFSNADSVGSAETEAAANVAASAARDSHDLLKLPLALPGSGMPARGSLTLPCNLRSANDELPADALPTRPASPGSRNKVLQRLDSRVDSKTLTEGSTTAIRVVARIRPKLPSESKIADGVECLSDEQSLQLSSEVGVKKIFTVDKVFDSRHPEQGSQQAVFDSLGRGLLQNALDGYNVCILAYGHTGSGKTFTMIGDGNATTRTLSSGDLHARAGLLPRFLEALFQIKPDPDSDDACYSCQYYEVYNEQIMDLLAPEGGVKQNRKLTVHPKYGARIVNLNMSVVSNADEALGILSEGNRLRAVATTTMNARSSRSHAIFVFKFEQAQAEGGKPQMSTVTFVDLAGREDHSAITGRAATIAREMIHINTSLFHLAHVISKISECQENVEKRSMADFRNSKLTLLLSDCLVGNSRTALVATVSPLQLFYEDAVSTMHFAVSVKKIKTRPVVNDKNTKTIVAELETEVLRLQKELNNSKKGKEETMHELLAAQALLADYERSWEDSMRQSMNLRRARTKGVSVIGSDNPYRMPRKPNGTVVPFLTRLCDDAVLQACCNYFLSKDLTRIGADQGTCDIVLQGLGIEDTMLEVCCSPEGVISVKLPFQEADLPPPRVIIQGKCLTREAPERVIQHTDCVILGFSHAFRLCSPSKEQVDAAGNVDANQLARATMLSLDVATAIAEVSDGQGEQFSEILPYVSQLSARISQEKMAKFMETIHSVCPLVDEANLVTRDIFGTSLHFEVHALEDMFHFGQSTPDLAVCLVQDIHAMSPLSRFQKGVASVVRAAQRSRSSSKVPEGRKVSKMRWRFATEDGDPAELLGIQREPLRHAMGIGDLTPLGDRGEILHLWSLEKFIRRLVTIREIYQQASDSGGDFDKVRKLLAMKPHMNPWREIGFCDTQILGEKCMLFKTNPVLSWLLGRRPSAGGVSMIGTLDSSCTEETLDTERTDLAEERTKRSKGSSPTSDANSVVGFHNNSPSDQDKETKELQLRIAALRERELEYERDLQELRHVNSQTLTELEILRQRMSAQEDENDMLRENARLREEVAFFYEQIAKGTLISNSMLNPKDAQDERASTKLSSDASDVMFPIAVDASHRPECERMRASPLRGPLQFQAAPTIIHTGPRCNGQPQPNLQSFASSSSGQWTNVFTPDVPRDGPTVVGMARGTRDSVGSKTSSSGPAAKLTHAKTAAWSQSARLTTSSTSSPLLTERRQLLNLPASASPSSSDRRGVRANHSPSPQGYQACRGTVGVCVAQRVGPIRRLAGFDNALRRSATMPISPMLDPQGGERGRSPSPAPGFVERSSESSPLHLRAALSFTPIGVTRQYSCERIPA